ncbi:MAG: transcriptional regulator, HxlR family [Sphaerisporangium sp.]|jgi:DNA-binding HxlR family transcriptional regulator|nr:transcriptional regulator, HxlR family [Sphaerisporangium sp.]
MPTSRSYGDACGIARALDVVGERWALLVVRELLLGPQRFSDLRRALAGASSNLVADRLRELEGRGVVRRRKLAPPANSWVYELTEWGWELEPIVLALGSWAVRVPLPPAPTRLSATSVLIFLRTCAQPDPKAPATVYRLELDDRVWTIRTAAGQVHVEPGEPSRADACLRADPKTLNALLDDPAALDAAMSDGSVVAAGDLSALRRLFQAVTIPSPAAPSAWSG